MLLGGARSDIKISIRTANLELLPDAEVPWDQVPDDLKMIKNRVLKDGSDEHTVSLALYGQDPLDSLPQDWYPQMEDIIKREGARPSSVHRNQPNLTFSGTAWMMRSGARADPFQLMKQKMMNAIENARPEVSRGRVPTPQELEAGYVRFWCPELGSIVPDWRELRWMGFRPASPYKFGRDSLEIFMEQDRLRTNARHGPGGVSSEGRAGLGLTPEEEEQIRKQPHVIV